MKRNLSRESCFVCALAYKQQTLTKQGLNGTGMSQQGLPLGGFVSNHYAQHGMAHYPSLPGDTGYLLKAYAVLSFLHCVDGAS